MKNSKQHPPNWARKLLERFCRPDYVDEILGDIQEAYYWRLKDQGSGKAKARFILEVLQSLRPVNLKTFYYFSINTMIIRNHLKIAFRTLLKKKSSSFINIFGLSVGVSAFILIFLYTNQILSFDDHHKNKDRIFLAYKERITPDGTQSTYDTWVPMKGRLKNDYNQVQEAARYFATDGKILKDNRYLEEEIIYTDESLFKMFSFPLLHGNPDNIFQNKYSVVLSVDKAYKYFNKANPIGETMDLFLPREDTTIRFQVSAILDHVPDNLSMQPEILVQMESTPTHRRYANVWSRSFLETFVLLDKGESAASLEAEFPDLVEGLWGTETKRNTNFRLLAYGSYYDTFLGNKSNARTLLWIGFGILLIAVINFMNLSTAQASHRAKEVGVRKVLGALKGQLRTQFMTEAFVTSLFATLLGIGIVLIGMPYFNDFFDVSISISQFTISEVVLFIFLLSILLGALCGSYPALYLSAIGTIGMMKIRPGGSAGFRNTLVIVQFSIALFLIACTLIVRNQINFMSQKGMGFDSEGILVVEGSSSDFIDEENGLARLNSFVDELQKKSYIREVAMSHSIPTSWTGNFTFVRPEEWTGDPLRMRYTFVDANFFNTYGIPLKSGQHFSDGIQGESVILNEAAMRAFQFAPEKQNVVKLGKDHRFNVVGVVEDFHFETLENEVGPTLFIHRTSKDEAHRYISCKMDFSTIGLRLQEIEKLWNGLGSTQPFTYSFMGDRVSNLYEAEKRYLGLVTMFSIISIVVACLGLYGLTLFIIEKRRKEISIRKVLGAELSTILRLIFRDFIKWVLIAFALSVPFAIYFVSDWLEAFHYRITISWITFGLTLLIVLGLVIVTVGYQSLKVASSNPTKYLADE